MRTPSASFARRAGLALGLMAAASVARAHPGHGSFDLAEGLAHPLGLDHLLAMVAVGMWSALALRGRAAVMGPAVFVAGMLAGALFGLGGWRWGGMEALIALSVSLLGVLIAGARRWPVAAGLVLVAMSAVVHGLAHGAELPQGADAASYVAGFLLSTSMLHAGGLFAGRRLQKLDRRVWQALGLLTGMAGLVLLARI